MHYKIMIAGDLHKRMKDITTIRGYCEVNRKIQLDLIQAIKDLGITHFISLGDWFDSGYGSDVSAALAHTDIDVEMSKVLKGNFYGLIGNHIRLRMDSNPELFLIQPHDVYKSRHPITRDYQIIKTPKDLILNGVQIHFMHWYKAAESAADYKAMINPDCHYHIGLYHTEYIIPSNYLYDLNMDGMASDNTVISRALDGINLAIVGHVHKAIGMFNIAKNDGTTTTMIVPGSLTNTDAGELSRHDYIDIPIIDIDEDGKVKLSLHHFNLRTNELKFEPKLKSNEYKEKLKSLRGNSKDALYEELRDTSFVGEHTQFTTLNMFFKEQGYTTCDKDMVRNVISNPEDIQSLRQAYMAQE